MKQYPINLSNLHLATAQQVFDQVVEHLLTQNAKSIDGDNCKYRDFDGRACAAGCLISDAEYEFLESDFYGSANEKGIEGLSWQGLQGLIGEFVSDSHKWLITDLQSIHDTVEVYDWEHYLRSYAVTNTLDWNYIGVELYDQIKQ